MVACRQKKMTLVIPSPKSYIDRNSGVAGLRIFHGAKGTVLQDGWLWVLYLAKMCLCAGWMRSCSEKQGLQSHFKGVVS